MGREVRRVGEGWEMWETCSEGSPISPVCDTPEELAKWLADNKASAGGSCTASYEDWLEVIKGPGEAYTFYGTPEGMISGVEAVAKELRRKRQEKEEADK